MSTRALADTQPVPAAKRWRAVTSYGRTFDSLAPAEQAEVLEDYPMVAMIHIRAAQWAPTKEETP